MATLDAFNSTLKSFLEELVDCCPDAPGIGKVSLFLASFDTVVRQNPRLPMDTFAAAMSPHADLIACKDSTLFAKAELPGGVSLKEGWDSMTPATQNAVWQYLQMLFLLATTASAVPPEMLTAIESVAATYADKIQNGSMDLGAVSNMLLGGLGGMDLFGGALPTAPPPKPKKKH